MRRNRSEGPHIVSEESDLGGPNTISELETDLREPPYSIC